MTVDRVRMTLVLTKPADRQLTEVSKRLHIPKAAVVRQAIVRWVATDPLLEDLALPSTESEDK